MERLFTWWNTVFICSRNMHAFFRGTYEIMFQYMNRLKNHMNTGGDEICYG